MPWKFSEETQRWRRKRDDRGFNLVKKDMLNRNRIFGHYALEVQIFCECNQYQFQIFWWSKALNWLLPSQCFGTRRSFRSNDARCLHQAFESGRTNKATCWWAHLVLPLLIMCFLSRISLPCRRSARTLAEIFMMISGKAPTLQITSGPKWRLAPTTIGKGLVRWYFVTLKTRSGGIRLTQAPSCFVNVIRYAFLSQLWV